MTATGLLSDRHARECIAAGYLGPWLAYFTDGTVHPAEPAVGSITIGDEDIAVDGWLVGLDLYMRDSATPETIESLERDGGLLGFSPPPGFWLPMEVTPRNINIPIRALWGSSARKAGDEEAVEWHRGAWHGEHCGINGTDDSGFDGWQPIVEVRL